MKELKLVIDSNLLVSVYSAASPRRDQWAAGLGAHRLYVSPEVFAQVERRLRQAEYHLNAGEIRACLQEILQRCQVVRPKVKPPLGVTNLQDRDLARLALEVKADRILTADTGARPRGDLAGVPMMTLSEFTQNNPRSAG